jgi:hypothetical protein
MQFAVFQYTVYVKLCCGAIKGAGDVVKAIRRHKRARQQRGRSDLRRFEYLVFARCSSRRIVQNAARAK